MDRSQWKAAFRELRTLARDSRRIGALSYGTKAARGWHSLSIMHGGTYWTVKYVAASDTQHGLHAYPSIIRDRATSARVEADLQWTARFRADAFRYRSSGDYAANERRRFIRAARGCLADARETRLSGSAFHAIAA